MNTPIINVQIRSSDDTTKLPPVHIKIVGNISTFISRLDSTDFICKSTPSYLIVLAHFREQYNLLLTYLWENDVSFHTYQPHAIFPLQVVIQNLHPTTSHEDIVAGPSELGHHITDIHNIKRFSDKTPLPLFFIDIQKATNNSDIIYSLSSFSTEKLLLKNHNHQKVHHSAMYINLMGTFKNTMTLIYDVKDVGKTTSQISILSQAVLQLNVLYGIIATP